MMTSTGSSGDTTKLNTLSRASASSASRTVARTLRSATVTGSKVADAEPRAATLTRRDWIARPPISSEISTFDDRDVAVIDRAGRHRDALLVLELRLLQRDRRDREVRLRRVGDRRPASAPPRRAAARLRRPASRRVENR